MPCHHESSSLGHSGLLSDLLASSFPSPPPPSSLSPSLPLLFYTEKMLSQELEALFLFPSPSVIDLGLHCTTVLECLDMNFCKTGTCSGLLCWGTCTNGAKHNYAKCRGENVYCTTRANCRRAEKYWGIMWKGPCPFALAQHTEKFGILSNVSSLCSSSVVATTEEEHKLETFGRIPNFSVCCAKANGHGPFHISKMWNNLA